MASKRRADALTTTQLYNLDAACELIRKTFARPPYLVGSAGVGTDGTYRDVDVRLMLDDDVFAEVCPDRARWELWCVAISTWLSERSGLPVDFQIQRTSEGNDLHDKPRNPLGTGRIFAGGGDGTPDWDAAKAVSADA